MAQVPGVPNPAVSPSGGALLSNQQLNAPALAFGANVGGEALSTFGRTFQQASDDFAQQAESIQALNNKTAADAKILQATSALDQQEIDFRVASQGMGEGGIPKAVTNLPAFHTTVSDIVDQFATGLSPLALAEYQSGVHQYAGSVLQRSASFTATENVSVQKSVATATINNAAAKYAATADDPAASEHLHEVVGVQSAILQHLNGWNPEELENFQRTTFGNAYLGQIENAANSGNYPKAQALYDAHKGEMQANQIDMAVGRLKTGAEAFELNTFGDDIVHGRDPVQETFNADRAGYLNATDKYEGTGDNPRSTAFGTGQFIKDTWLHTMRTDPQFAKVIKGKTEEQILALRSDKELGHRAIGSYAAENEPLLRAAGITPNAATIGLAHNLGPGDAVKVLKAPAGTAAKDVLSEKVIAANPHLASKTTGQIVAAAQHRFGTGGIGAQVTANTLTPPTYAPNSDPRQVELDYDAYIRGRADLKYGANITMRDKAIQVAQSKVKDQILRPMQLNQSAAVTRQLDAIVSGHISDAANMTMAYPGAANDLAIIPPEARRQLNASLRANANELTPERQESISALEEMHAQDPAKFAKVNLAAVDLRPADRARYYKQQMTVISSTAAVKQVDTIAKQALGSLAGQEAVRSLGLTVAARNGDEEVEGKYWQFTGALAADIANFAAVTGKPPIPGSKEMNSLISQVTAKVGAKKGSWFFNMGGSEGTPVFEVPADKREAVIAALREEGNANPSVAQIAARYRMATRAK